MIVHVCFPACTDEFSGWLFLEFHHPCSDHLRIQLRPSKAFFRNVFGGHLSSAFCPAEIQVIRLFLKRKSQLGAITPQSATSLRNPTGFYEVPGGKGSNLLLKSQISACEDRKPGWSLVLKDWDPTPLEEQTKRHDSGQRTDVKMFPLNEL